MVCNSCGEKPIKACNDFTKRVIEINNPEQITLLRKVVIPVSMGDDTVVKPVIGKYHNVVLHYEANKHTYLYSSDGIPTLLEMDVPQEVLDRITSLENGLEKEIKDRSDADTALQENIDAEEQARKDADEALDDRLSSAEETLSTALQPEDIDKVMLKDISLDPTSSSSEVKIKELKENLMSSAQSTESLTLPVASSSQAGVINSLTYDTIVGNSSKIEALSNGAVAISGLPASPTQADLTSAWEQETGYTELMNRANIYDVTNDKVWTYYANDSTWYASSNTSQVTVSTFTNNSEGVIKGSLNDGQVSAELDGTGTVNGWTALKNSVDNKQDKLTELNAGNAIEIEDEVINAAVYPEDFFTAGKYVYGEGTDVTLEKTIEAPISSVELRGDMVQASVPEPSTPVDINTVTGEQTITIDGKNLFDKDNANIIYGYFTGDVQTSTITLGSEYARNVIVYIPCDPSTTYTVNVNMSRNDVFWALQLGTTTETPAEGVTVTGTGTSSSSGVMTITTGAGAAYLVIRLQTTNMYIKNVLSMLLERLQVEIGSVSTTYSPYRHQEYKLNLGKNLFNKNDYNALPNSYFDDGGVIATSGSQNYIIWIPCKPNTPYSFVFPTSTTNPPFNIKRIGTTSEEPAEGVTVSGVTSDIQRGTATYNNYVTANDAKFLCVRFQGSSFGGEGGGLYRVLNEFQIEEGESSSEYAPYIEPIELCKMGRYQDYIYSDGEDWYLHKEIGKETYDGSESGWEVFRERTGGYNSVERYPSGMASRNAEVVCSHFKYYNADNPDAGSHIYTFWGSGGAKWYFPNTIATTMEEWLDWLEDNNMSLYYPLASAINIKIDEPTLVSQLDSLGRAKASLGTTTISVEAKLSNLPVLLKLVLARNSLASVLAILNIFDNDEWDALWA